MADLNQPENVKTYFQHIADQHVDLSHFYYGHIDRLDKGFKREVKKHQYVLYVEWPQKNYQDNGGSVQGKLRPSISILRAINKEDHDAQDEAVEKCYEILDDIIARMRREIFLQGHIFRIQDVGTIDPVYHYLIDNAIGCRAPIALGDWVSIQINAAKWNDGYSGT